MPERAERPIEDPQADLERALIEDYLRERGCDLATIDLKTPGERRTLLVQAAQYAAVKLAEIDARAAYVEELHKGVPKR
jgi:hypothetical protein